MSGLSVALSKKIRQHIVKMTSRGGSSHVGSGLSIADIVAVLYAEILNHKPEFPDYPSRDRFILSKGHAGACIYAALAECGYFSTDLLKTHYQDGSLLSGHVSHKQIPGVEISTGSLGCGLGIGAGIALELKNKESVSRVFVLGSDGECDEGTVWEAALFAQHHHLQNLVYIVDYNKLQSLDTTDNTLTLEPLVDKWKAFNWNCIEVNGHCHSELISSLKSGPSDRNNPTVVIAHTIKGKGVSFMENSVLWHYRSPSESELNKALIELKKS